MFENAWVNPSRSKSYDKYIFLRFSKNNQYVDTSQDTVKNELTISWFSITHMNDFNDQSLSCRVTCGVLMARLWFLYFSCT